MATKTASRRTRSEKNDSIRIVPIRLPYPSLEAAPAANMTYRGGPLLTGVQVFTIFWGPAWQTAPVSDQVGKLNQFFDFILTSQLIDQMSEYNRPGKKIGHGKRIGTLTITKPALKHSITDGAIQSALQQLITGKKVPKPTANTLYFIYMPPGVKVTQGGSGSCTAFCGYHDSINGKIFYAVMPYPGCQGCTGALAEFDALTSTSSHELCEAITDPIPGQGWYDDVHGEIGDICAWQTRTLGPYTIQLEWSNQKGACI
ncbi:MAG TPA: hypothetical protein VEI47_05390 [Gemmatimonadales bacterium]|jgi:hypothetical protein|nr:hypothetical protein [Gemmatimonadales bacterium]